MRLRSWLTHLTRLRWRLFILFLTVGLLPLLFFTYTTNKTVEDYYYDQKSKELMNQANRISLSIRQGKWLTPEGDSKMFTEEIWSRSEAEGFRIIVVDKNAVVVHDSYNSELGKTFVLPEIMGALNKKDVAMLQEGTGEMIAAVSVLSDNSDVLGAVLVIDSAEEVGEILSDISGKSFLTASVLAAIIFVLAFIMSQLIISPLKNIIESVRRITQGHLNQRVKPSGSEEFAELALAFNDMTSKLDQIENIRQEFVSNVSHELKTPLSSMKVLSESLITMDNAPVETYREFLQDINSEVDRMTMIINELLQLVKLDRTEQALNIRPVRLNDMIGGILKRLYPLAEQKGIELLFEDVKDVIADVDEMKMSLAISNLVENGIKYTGDGGTVKIIVDANNQNAFITVLDNGIGIAEDQHGKVFDRFYRVDKTRDRETGGTGLGLAITHKTVLMHNGSIKLASSEGEGSSFIVRLPLHSQE